MCCTNTRPRAQKEQAFKLRLPIQRLGSFVTSDSPSWAVQLTSAVAKFSTALRSHLFQQSSSGTAPQSCPVAPSPLSLHPWRDTSSFFPLVRYRPAPSASPTTAGRSVPSLQGFSVPCSVETRG